MKRLLALLALIPALAVSQNLSALDSLIAADPLLKTSQLGLVVFDLDADSTLYALNARQTMRPASTMKLLTAITALDRLGTAHRFTTTAAVSGQQRERTLCGDLYIRGGMDPTFSEFDMKEIVEALRSQQIDTIAGALIADRTFKDTDLLGEGWCWDDDNPTLTPLPYNRKDGFLVSLRTMLDEAGIVILGCDSIAPTPARASTLVQITTPLPVVLQKTLKDSDNLYAEALFYQLGAIGGRTATAKSAQQHEKQLINKLGLNAADYRLADGSGLSLYNHLSPELEVRLLRHAYRNKHIFDALYAALPIAGVDGTLKKRMTSTPAYNNVRAKTGSLTAIYSLAGFALAPTDDQDRHLAFCIINQGALSARQARDFQDKVCALLCSPSPIACTGH